ncbi:unnamed protein product [Dovyalis caffra]|uniref:ABC-type xenobiotic transporter n=1 Tax=Dovyalis caffra TaxID=77055 RepID=A0AAV1RIF5_9ROSI|nr:unnamed protein product [Dovyalis caffra]
MRVAVCGTVGSGKSSLLSSSLGELHKISGTLKLCGTKAYVSQSPWIQSAMIEENILFGKEMDRERYEKVLEACSLKKDLEILSFGDQTVIGERGINLSGGQKQRIQIALALYHDAQIYLFDDPFSSVDAHTGSHLFKEVLLGLLSSKTVIYVTHQVEFLSAADLILVTKGGRIVQAGKYDDILNSGSDFMKEGNNDSQIGEAGEVAKAQAQLIPEEEREKGSAGFPIYWKYVTTAYGGVLVPFILLSQLLFQILQIGSTYWMAWATPVSMDAKPAVSNDQNALDMEIPNQVGDLALEAIELLGIVAVMSQVAWQVFIVSIPVIAACVWHQHGLATILSNSSSMMHSPGSNMDFLLKSVFLRGFSGSLHLALLLALFVSFVCKKLRVGDGEGSKERLKMKNGFLLYKQTLLCCLGVSLFNLILFLLSYFYSYRNGWSDDKVVTVLDLVLRTLSWGALFVYLYTQFFNSGEKVFPSLLRVWWGFYLAISCHCFVVDLFFHHKHGSLEIEYYVVSDVVSVFTGLFLCYVGFSRSEIQDVLEEHLLSGDSSSINNLETSKSRGGDTVTPYGNANLFSILTFSWMNSLIAAGNEKILDLEDVPQLHSVDSVVEAFPVFKNKLESDCGTASRFTVFKLAKALFLSAWKQILWTALLALIHTLGSYVGPYLIDAFVQCLDGRGEFKNQGYILVSIFLVAKLAECLSQKHLLFKMQQMGTRLRAVTTTMIYNKSLTLSCQSKQGRSSGEIINIMTIDANRLSTVSWYVHDPWLVILQVSLALLILYKNLGLGSVAGFVTTVIVMLLNYPFGRLEEKFQGKLMESKDKRMKATTEILKNMKILKLQGWEMKFLSKIVELREVETQWLKKYFYTSLMITFILFGAPNLVAVATFLTSMLMGVPLESGKVISALATFEILQVPIYKLPDTVSKLIQTKVSLDRIASFLALDDLRPDVIEKLPVGSSDAAIEIVDGNFSWDLSSPNATLKDVNFKAYHGMRVAVCGAVGSGKSSLLSSILGELPKISGTLKLCGTKAYVAQSPWIQSGTIEENILFGKDMDRERYEKVLEACSLKKDLEILSFGDQTVIGERGINLSGGQKQRIQIARALYQDAQIYLFDDPFSAVDAHTGSHLFKVNYPIFPSTIACFLLGLLSSKTVIYVTHQVEFLSTADLILVMKDGRIAQAGKYDDILNSGSDFMVLVGAHKAALSVLDSKQAGPVSENESVRNDNGEINSTDGIVWKEGNNDSQTGEADEVAKPQAQLIQEEERVRGSVGFPIYWKYITTAYRGALVPFILLAQLLFMMLQISSTYWMAWATPASKDVKPVVSGSRLLIVYASLVIGSSFCVLARASLLVTAGYKTASLLFSKMHQCIFHAPMSFFDATPSGRILNRASTDQNVVEMDIPFLVGELAFQAIQLLGIIAVISQVAWQVFVVSIPVIAACIWYQQYYIPSARELSRLVGVCNAPIIQNFAETISGATTIRSFDQESRFQEINMRLIDAYSRPKIHNSAALQWLSIRMDMLSSVTFAFSLFLLVSFPERINPAIAGLAVAYALGLHMTQYVLIWLFCNCENKIIAVERILQYMSLPAEPPLVIEATRPDHSWPSHGEVDIDNLQVRYAPHMPLVLRGLTCTFPGGMKTGIVGRTGSGKSTLIQTLFRIVEPAAGRIMIDGIDISMIGLHDLRSRLSIIPQDPTMFEGTVRSNLDPLEEYTDEQIWEALDKFQLGDEVRKKEMKLNSTVIENGENWSMGQRQLLCLGRVLLKKSKVLVLDEATASVDTATDSLIQQTVRQHFSGCTVITVAHRITSVLDSDMVLLLSSGLIEEYDSPTRLLENKSSSFSQLVAEYTVRSNTSFEKST